MLSKSESKSESRILHLGDSHVEIGKSGHIERVRGEREIIESLETADCVLCEHAPPDHDALSSLETIRKRDSALPVLVLTADETVVPDVLSAGATDCVRPGSPELLAHRIERAIDQYRTQHRQSQTEALLSGMPDAIITIGEDGSIKCTNDGVERVFGYESDELVGSPLTELIPERLQSTHRKSLARYVKTGEQRVNWGYVETTAQHRNGAEIPVGLSFREGRYDGERTITGIVRDISKRKRVEAELEQSRERYRKVIETSPEAILVADTETGSIIEANPAAETLLGRPQNEIIGMHHSEIHPVGRRAFYRHIFDQHAERGGVTKDATGINITRPSGTEIPVEVSSNVTELGDQQVLHAIFKDVSERNARERSLSRLRSATRDLMRAETKDEICEVAVSAASEILDLSLCGIYLVDAEECVLRPAAVTGRAEKILDEIPKSEAENTLAWSVFESGEATVFDDLSDKQRACNSETPVETELILPLADHGVFVVGSVFETELDEHVHDFAEILAANVQSALDRAEREETLSKHREELEELNRINAVIRDVDRTLVQATSREEIESAVAERLVTVEPYQFTWIGEYDASAKSVYPVAHAGDEGGKAYLESAIRPNDEFRGPATKALETENVVVIADIATDPTFEPWREESLDRGFRSLAAIPIRYDETCYGVLVVHANQTGAFDERERAVLAELGETIGLAIAGIESRKALVSDCVVEVEIESKEANNVFVQLPQELGCELDLLGNTLASDGALLCFVTVSGAESSDVIDWVSGFDRITDSRILHETETECVLELRYEKAPFVTALADRGATVASAEADEDGARAVIELPTTANVRGMVEAIRDMYPDMYVVAQRERDTPEPTVTEFRTTLGESLTDRQWTALETAYLAGFFEWPRNSTGEDVAASLGVSPPTFHQHLRRAQLKLLGTFFDR
ncbi:PAS domain S-box-containing protein [Haladaptatus litoreus]|uniref:PAS domain S-box-containing protein n=1 Tax=Haladaptatus litoreus TaxID=553468 RepID=A0A1N7E0S8_9EURY|nr:PAS domain S-box protein [Haladaptatus litoreus]SIR81717.1 PAS domain S-box-containing protein [Haladaptatus litoreus]